MAVLLGIRIKAIEAKGRWNDEEAVREAFFPWSDIVVIRDVNGDIYIGRGVTHRDPLRLLSTTFETLKSVLTMGLPRCGILDADKYLNIHIYLVGGGDGH